MFTPRCSCLDGHSVRDYNWQPGSRVRAPEVAVDAEDPALEAEWQAAERRRILEFAMQRVRDRADSRTWQCFELHILQGRPIAEVAAATGLTANAVYVNASRVLARVREQCLEYADD